MPAALDNAYSQWARFGSNVRASGGLANKSGGLRAVNYQADILAGPRVSQAVEGTIQALSQFAGAYSNARSVEADEADTRAKDWMRTKTVREYREAMRQGQVPFQADPLAMAALHRSAGTALAFEVEERISNEVKQGKYKDPAEADKARIEALEGARSEWYLQMGMAPDSARAFNTGFNVDSDQRRAAIQGLQQDVTDKNLRQQALIAVNSNLTAPMTAQALQSAGPEFWANYMTQTLTSAQLNGQIRSPEEALQVLQSGIQNLSGVAGGADVLRALGDKSIDIGGSVSSIRTHMGGGLFDQTVLRARDAEQQQNTERYSGFQAQVLELQRSGNLGAVDVMIKQREAESDGKTTTEIAVLHRLRGQIVDSLDRQNAQIAAKVEAESAEFGQYQTGLDGIRQFLGGGLVSGDYKDLGFKDAAQGRQAEAALLNTIQDPTERLSTAIKLSTKFTDGFSAKVLQERKSEAAAQYGMYTAAIARGDQGAVMGNTVNNMVSMYERDPVAFTMAFGEQPYIQLHEAGKSVGMSMQDMVMAKVRFDGLPEQVRKETNDMLTGAIMDNAAGKTEAYATAIRGLAAPLIQIGVPPEDAIERAQERFESQNIQIGGSWIHKSFFTPDNTRKSAAGFSQSLFNDEVLPRLRGSIGDPDSSSTAIDYVPNQRAIYVWNLETGAHTMFTREQMYEEVERATEKARMKENLKQESVIQKLTKRAKIVRDNLQRDGYSVPEERKQTPLQSTRLLNNQ